MSDIDELAVDLQNIDVVVSGGWYYDGFWFGAKLILDRLADQVNIQRTAGVSAGGYTPFEIALKGLDKALEDRLSYCQLEKENPNWFTNSFTATWSDNHLRRVMAEWQTEKYADKLSDLDGKVFVGASCFNLLPPSMKTVQVSNFTTENDQAIHIYMATGTFFGQIYEGKFCMDGGATTGPRMTPLFQDDERDQMIIDLMMTGYPEDYATKCEIDHYLELIHAGMEEMKSFLTTGKTSVARDGIIQICPTGSEVSENVCAKKEDSLKTILTQF